MATTTRRRVMEDVDNAKRRVMEDSHLQHWLQVEILRHSPYLVPNCGGRHLLLGRWRPNNHGVHHAAASYGGF